MIVATTRGVARVGAVGVVALALPALLAGVEGGGAADGAVVRSGASLARADAVTELVSMSSEGAQGNDDSARTYFDGYAVSGDGRFVAFTSFASNLVADDTNGDLDVFVRDLVAGTTERVSVSTTGLQADGRSAVGGISADGRYVVFGSSAPNLVADDTNDKHDVFVRDRQEGTTVRVSVGSHGEQADGGSFAAAISADGRLVAFTSRASNLVRRDTNDVGDVFVRNLVRGRTARVSVSTEGEQGNGTSYAFEGALSRTGRFVVFETFATNLAPDPGYGVLLRDRRTGTTTHIACTGTSGFCEYPGISADGRVVVYDRSHRTVHYRDIASSQPENITPTVEDPGTIWTPSVSADGRYVVYLAGFVLPVDEHPGVDGFLYDHDTGATSYATLTATGNPARDPTPPIISGDGQWIVFASGSPHVVPNDTNNASDVFIRHR